MLCRWTMNTNRMNWTRRLLIRSMMIGFLVVVALAGDAGHVVQAQTYCAMFDDGNKSCGIPSLDSCRQTISGVGGYCTPDQTSQMRPDVFDGSRLFPGRQDPAPPATGPRIRTGCRRRQVNEFRVTRRRKSKTAPRGSLIGTRSGLA